MSLWIQFRILLYQLSPYGSVLLEAQKLDWNIKKNASSLEDLQHAQQLEARSGDPIGRNARTDKSFLVALPPI